jgi:hypothetical protein
MNISSGYTYIRKLAKSDYWQTVYSLSEKMKIRLFANDMDFTRSQILLLKYLNFYSQIYMDIALGDVTELVLEDELYEDAYYFYKTQKDKEKFKKEEIKNQKESTPTTRWIFKKLPKK